MLKKVQNLIVVLIILSLIGCATTYKVGKMFKTDNVSKIEIGKTTQQEIIKMFGEPWRKGIANGNDVYIYTDEEIIFEIDDRVNRKGNTLLIEFDREKIVENYYLNVPGKETLLFGYFLHKRNKEKKQEAAQQNQMAMQPGFQPPAIKF